MSVEKRVVKLPAVLNHRVFQVTRNVQPPLCVLAHREFPSSQADRTILVDQFLQGNLEKNTISQHHQNCVISKLTIQYLQRLIIISIINPYLGCL